MKVLTESLEFRLREFHSKYGQYVSLAPTTDIPFKVRALREQLITEEWTELMEAIRASDLTKIADGCADLVYVVIGTAIAYGIPFDRVFSEVHISNMTKTPVKAAEGEKYGTKTPKGPNFRPPEIDKILFFTGETELEKQTQKDPPARQEAEGE